MHLAAILILRLEAVQDATFEATMKSECAGVTVGQGKECGDAIESMVEGAINICLEGGGCLIDVAEALC